ncbi:uncharacterized protein PG998_013087 [Apiospora kogelbergensis]|uniref:uncharacterized protein n=1 Tax=Apiospora kogelbergensis TaxID=1337665 RepID=UPI00312E70B6
MYAAKIFVFIAAVVSASPISSLMQAETGSVLAAREAPKHYSGTWDKFPAKKTWKSFDALWKLNTKAMKAKGDTDSDLTNIKKALQSVGKKYGIEDRVLLAMMMQESHGDVGAITTYSQPDNFPTGGLFQCWKCPGFYGKHGLTLDQITSMVEGGAKHFKENLSHWGNTMEPKSVYPALRMYNSGNVNEKDLSSAPNATPAYVSDIAQRLGGWTD